jgi:hypothetical protein
MQFTPGTRVLLNIDDEGMHFRTDITIPPPREAFRRVLVRLRSVYRAIYYSFFPVGFPVLVVGRSMYFADELPDDARLSPQAVTAIVVGVVVTSPRTSWFRSGPIASFVWSISEHLWWMEDTP